MNENQINPNENQNNNSSMLDSIITTPTRNDEEIVPTSTSTSQILADGGLIGTNNNGNSGNQNNPPQPIQPKKPKRKMTPGEVLRIFGALFFAGAVLFGAFISYIIFNPGDAKFFINFGIDPQQIKNYIQLFVNISFGTMTIILSIVSMIFLFTAFVTKKEYAKKKTIATIMSIFFILVLFVEITFWIWLTSIIGATNYLFLDGGVIIRDNDKLMSKKFNDGSDVMNNFDNLIGPITIKLDLSADVEFYSKSMNIKGYRMDFNGDKVFEKEGLKPAVDQDIIFTYDKAGSYQPTGEYYGTKKITGEEIVQPIKIPSINISGIVKMEEKKERLGGKSVKFDVSEIKKLGKIDFYLQDKTGNFSSPDANYNGTDNIFSPLTVFKDEAYICLAIKNNQKVASDCDKMFIVGAESKQGVNAKIKINKDPLNSLGYNFQVDLGGQTNSMIKYFWVIDGKDQAADVESLDYKFELYGKHTVSVKVVEPSGNEYVVEEKMDLKKPLIFTIPSSMTAQNNSSLIKILNKNGDNLAPNNFVRELGEYHIAIRIPSDIKFDSNYVKVTDNYYSLIKTEWDFDGDGKFEKLGNDMTNKFYENKKITMYVKYTFFSDVHRDTQEMVEKIVFEADKNDISVKLDVKQETDYAPAVVHFDGSASSVKEGSLVKFVYDFGEGKKLVEGDAKQDYIYNYPGEFDVVFTVTKEDGMKDSIKKKIIVKEQGKKAILNSSVSSGFVGKQIDFDAVGENGQIATLAWDFGDGSSSSEPTPTHIYNTPGVYDVKLIITFTDGIIKTGNKEMTIK